MGVAVPLREIETLEIIFLSIDELGNISKHQNIKILEYEIGHLIRKIDE